MRDYTAEWQRALLRDKLIRNKHGVCGFLCGVGACMKAKMGACPPDLGRYNEKEKGR